MFLPHAKKLDKGTVVLMLALINQSDDGDITKLFLLRLSALKQILNKNNGAKYKARKFLLETMTQPEEEYNFPLKEKFVKNVKNWGEPIILAKRSDTSLCAIVYTINYRTHDDAEKKIYEISFFTKGNEGQYKYSHNYNLTELYEEFCMSSNIETTIRQIGDEVLHRPAKKAEQFCNKLQDQVSILKKTLTATGGVGIAANQCSLIDDPLQIILVGVDYNNPEHVVKAITRYPSTLFPRLKVYINPVMTTVDNETNLFAEGCLSVQGAFRGMVKRAQAVTVSYQDIPGDFYEDVFFNTDARVMLHELDHILNGKVYFQRIIEELTETQCKQLIKIIITILARKESAFASSFLSPTVLFDRDLEGKIVFDIVKVEDYFKQVRKEVLVGLKDSLNNKLTQD